MPRVHFVKKARKDNPVAKKGESYYWWKFRYGGKRYSRVKPRPSQLTRSAYFGTVRAIIEQIEDSNPSDFDAMVLTTRWFDSLREEVRSQLEDLMEETQSSLDNMPDQLQYSPTGELLQERIDALEGAISEMDYIDEFEYGEEEPLREDFEDAEEYTEAQQEWEEDREREFYDWLDTAKSDLIDYVAAAEV